MDGKEETAVLDPETLEKSFDESITALRTLLGGGDDDKATDLEKAKKQPPEDEESGDEEEEETDEEEEEEEEGPHMKKSLPDLVAEGSEEAAAAMDVEPFLKSLAEGIQKYLDQSFENLHKSLVGKITAVGELTKSMGKATLVSAEMQKSIRDVVYKIGKTPIPTGTILRKSGDRFEAGKEEAASTDGNRTRAEQVKVLTKSHELLQKGQIDIVMATKIEGRVTKNLPLPPEVAELFAEGGKQ